MMKNLLKLFTISFLVTLLAGGVAYATVRSMVLELTESGAIKTWQSGEAVTAADLNANFQHIHNVMVGGHGGRLTDTDVSATATIKSSKLQAYRLIPTAWAAVANGACAATPCAIVGSGVTTVARTGAGVYTVTLTTNPIDANFGVVLGTSATYCVVSGWAITAPQFTITCNAATDSRISFAVFDDN